jgi:hypothetical protein
LCSAEAAGGSDELTFDDFIVFVLVYAMFTKEQILQVRNYALACPSPETPHTHTHARARANAVQFVFTLFDTDANGHLDEEEFVSLVKKVNPRSPLFPTNYTRALAEFSRGKHKAIRFKEFKRINKAFPQLFYEAYKLQDAVWRKTLGYETWIALAQSASDRNAALRSATASQMEAL